MTTPSSREALDRVLQAGRRSLHTSFPARVLAYDVAAQTVDVEPQLMRELEDDEGALAYETLPVLYDVPVQWQRAGGFVLTFPITVGDFVEIQCAEQSTLAWRDSGQVSEPGLSQPHGLNGAIAKPGWYPDTLRLTGVSTRDVVLGTEDGEASVRVKPDGTVVLGADPGSLAIALAPYVEAAITAAIGGHTHVVNTTGTAVAQSGTSLGGVLGGAVQSTAAKKVKAL